VTRHGETAQARSDGASRPDVASLSQWLADDLRARGCDRMFTLLGESNLELVECLRRSGVDVIRLRHEQAVVGAADGCARFTHRPAFCSVAPGAGVTNAATSLLEAAAAASPVLLVTAAPPGAAFRQAEFIRSMGIPVFTAAGGPDVSAALDAVWQHLQSGPCVLQLGPPDGFSPTADPLHAPVDPLEVDTIGAVRAMLRPLVIVGRGALRARHGREAAKAIGQQLGAPLVTTLPAAGFVNGLNAGLGTIGELGVVEANRALTEADGWVALGTSLSPWSTMGTQPEHVVRVVSETEWLPTRPRSGWTWLRAGADWGSLPERFTGRPAPAPWFERDAASAPRGLTAPGTMGPGLTAASAVATVRDRYPDDRYLIDGGHACAVASRVLLERPAANQLQVAYYSGAIGQAAHLALGAAVSRRDMRLWCFAGDVAAAMSITDWDTAVQQRLRIRLVILNDQGAGQEALNLQVKGFPEDLADQASPRFADLMRALGGAGHDVAALAGLVRALEAEEDNPGPVVFDLAIPRRPFDATATRIAERFADRPADRNKP